MMINALVRKRAILNHPGKQELPGIIIRNELLELMLKSYDEDGVVVVFADRGMGKTTAAAFLLKNSAGGIMFCNARSESSSQLYWKGVAEAIGVPSNVYEKSPKWKTLLVEAVEAAAAKTSETAETSSESAWMNDMLDRFTSFCGTAARQ